VSCIYCVNLLFHKWVDNVVVLFLIELGLRRRQEMKGGKPPRDLLKL
jgi:hypothetical protein